MQGDTEHLIYSIDLIVQGATEAAPKVAAVRTELDKIPQSASAAKSAYADYLRESEADLKATMAAMEQGKRTANEWAEAFRGAQPPVRELQRELLELRAQIVGLRSAQAASGTKEFAGEIRGLQLEIQQVSQQLRVAQAAQAEHTQSMRGGQQVASLFAGEITRTAGGLAGLSQGLRGASGAAMGLTTGSATAAVGVAGLGVASAAAAAELVHLGTQANATAGKIANAANVSVEQGQRILESFRGLGPQIAQDTNTIGEAYASVAGKLGTYQTQALSAAQATEVMRVAGLGALASNEKLNVATRALTEGITATRAGIGDAEQIMSVLLTTSANTGIGLDQTAKIAGRLSDRMGESAPTIRGLGEALTLAAQAGAQGEEQLEPVITLMERLSHPSEKAKQDLEGLGIQIVKNADGQMQFAQTFSNLKAGYDNLATPQQRHALLVNLIGEQTGILERMLKSTPEQLNAIVAAYENTNRLADAAAKRQQELAVQMNAVTAAAKGEVQALGEGLARVLVEVADAGARFGRTINELPEPAKKLLGLTASSAIPGVSQAAGLIAQMGEDTAAAQRASLVDSAPIVPGEGINPAGGAGTTYGPSGAEAGQRQALDVASIRARADALSGMSAEAARAAAAMDVYQKSQQLPSDQIKVVTALTEATNQQALALERAYDPERPNQAAQRLATLRKLTDDYTAAVAANDEAQTKAAAAALNGFQRQIASQDAQIERQRRIDTAARSAAAEQQRIINEQKRLEREAAAADVGTGLAEAKAKGLQSADLKADLDPAAAKVMDDFNAALAAHGTSRGAETGRALGAQILNIAEEMRRSGAGDWQETMAQMFDTADAIRRGEPGATQAMHDLALHASQEIDQAKIDEAWGRQLASAAREIQRADMRLENQRADAATRYAEQTIQINQQEINRIADARARANVEEDVRKERHRLDDERQELRYNRESEDRADTHARALTEIAERNRRSMTDLSIRQAESDADLQRARNRENIDQEHQHQLRIAEIRRQGGPDVARKVADEERTYQESVQERNRTRGLDDTERRIKAGQQTADAARRQVEAVADLQQRERDADADRAKARARQEKDRDLQQNDQDAIAAAKANAEKKYGVDPETVAKRQLTEQTRRIDQQYAHQLQTASRAYDQEKGMITEKLGSAYGELAAKFPWITGGLGGVAIPSNLVPRVTAPAGAFPTGPLPAGGANAPASSAPQSFTIELNFDGATFVGGEESARHIVDWIEPVLLSKLRARNTAGGAFI